MWCIRSSLKTITHSTDFFFSLRGKGRGEYSNLFILEVSNLSPKFPVDLESSQSVYLGSSQAVSHESFPPVCLGSIFSFMYIVKVPCLCILEIFLILVYSESSLPMYRESLHLVAFSVCCQSPRHVKSLAALVIIHFFFK